jgi:ParB family chromosome partitioning protein
MAETGKTRLGRGLSALLGDLPADAPASMAAGGVREIPIRRCTPNPHQPRERFDEQADRELAASVKERGVLQPILVTTDAAGGYLIVAGERRWRAARTAGLETIPALVRKLEPREMIEFALVENLQREDLNGIEEAQGYRELAESFGLTQAEIAERVGKERSSITNALRLLDLASDVQELVREGKLSKGHARALLGVSDSQAQVRFAREVVARGLSVRQVEGHVRRGLERVEHSAPRVPRRGSAQVRALEGQLQRALGTKVRIAERRRGAGMIQVWYHSSDEFERLRDIVLRGSGAIDASAQSLRQGAA